MRLFVLAVDIACYTDPRTGIKPGFRIKIGKSYQEVGDAPAWEHLSEIYHGSFPAENDIFMLHPTPSLTVFVSLSRGPASCDKMWITLCEVRTFF